MIFITVSSRVVFSKSEGTVQERSDTGQAEHSCREQQEWVKNLSE